MSFNNFVGANASDYPTFSSDANPFESSNSEPSTSAIQASGSDLGPALSSLSTAEIENWWLAPRSDSGAGQYAGSTLLDPSWGEFPGSNDTQAGYTSGTTEYNRGFVFNALGEQYVDAPEHAGFPTASLPTAPHLTRPAEPPSHPATFVGPTSTPSPIPTLSWGYSPLPIDMYTAAGNDRSDMYNQPLAAPDLRDQWLNPTSVSDTMWQFQQLHVPENFEAGLNPQTGASVPNADLLAQVAPSTGPRRSVRHAKGKGEETKKGKGKRKLFSTNDLPPGTDWPNTRDRFCAEMAEIYLNQPTGEVANPEAAYARSTEFVKDDLYLSPLVVKPLGERQSRDLEQYLLGILTELRPRTGGQKKGVQYMLKRVAEELEDELVVVNDDFVLLDGPSNEIDPEELDASAGAVRRRAAEKARRGGIRQSLERMTLFFRLPGPEYLFSRPQVLFFAITYLVFGAGVFGNGGEFFTQKPQP